MATTTTPPRRASSTSRTCFVGLVVGLCVLLCLLLPTAQASSRHLLGKTKRGSKGKSGANGNGGNGGDGGVAIALDEGKYGFATAQSDGGRGGDAGKAKSPGQQNAPPDGFYDDPAYSHVDPFAHLPYDEWYAEGGVGGDGGDGGIAFADGDWAYAGANAGSGGYGDKGGMNGKSGEGGRAIVYGDNAIASATAGDGGDPYGWYWQRDRGGSAVAIGNNVVAAGAGGQNFGEQVAVSTTARNAGDAFYFEKYFGPQSGSTVSTASKDVITDFRYEDGKVTGGFAFGISGGLGRSSFYGNQYPPSELNARAAAGAVGFALSGAYAVNPMTGRVEGGASTGLSSTIGAGRIDGGTPVTDAQVWSDSYDVEYGPQTPGAVSAGSFVESDADAQAGANDDPYLPDMVLQYPDENWGKAGSVGTLVDSYVSSNAVAFGYMAGANTQVNAIGSVYQEKPVLGDGAYTEGTTDAMSGSDSGAGPAGDGPLFVNEYDG